MRLYNIKNNSQYI